MSRAAPIRVAVVNDYELVVRGVAGLLAPFPDRLMVVELDARLDVDSKVDIALFDAFTMEAAGLSTIAKLADNPTVSRTVVYTWNLRLPLVKVALESGADGVLSKTLEPHDLVSALESIHAGLPVISPDPGPDAAINHGRWPGQDEGLTAREAEVVALIVRGMSNAEIAEHTRLSANSVKSYIRSAYRTMGVTSRSKAILWGLQHGMQPFPTRKVADGADTVH